MKKLVIALAATAALISGFSSGAQAQEKKKVCFVYVGSRTDGGWTQANELGRQQLLKALGDKIEAPFLETFRKARMPSAPSSAWPVPAAR